MRSHVNLLSFTFPARERNKRHLSVPTSKEVEVVNNFVGGTLNISSPAGLTIKNLVQTKKKKAINEESVVYKIPCGACDKCYIGETYRGIETRRKEHKSDLRYHRISNALVQHVDEAGHLRN